MHRSQPSSIENPELCSETYLGQWNRLVSSTNWEKGRIIHDWRSALMASDANASDWSDDAWSRRVGNVTGQHVGRLRRVYERFGGVHTDYAGLYWSHFQAAIDWNDAEMWLEGAVQNRWSVSEMRRERWLAFGGSADQQPSDSDVVAAEVDEDGPSDDARPAAERAPFSESQSEASGPLPEGPDFGDEPAAGDAFLDSDRPVATETSPAQVVRPFAALPSLPDDLTEAFENFKLAILRHKASDWRDVSCDDVLTALDSLKILAAAPSE